MKKGEGSCGCGAWEPGPAINNHSEWLSADVFLVETTSGLRDLNNTRKIKSES